MSWPKCKLSDLASSIDYGVTASACNEPLGPKFLRITDIQDGAVNWDSVPYCQCSSRERRALQLLDGDIVFARTDATTGKSFRIRSAPSESVFASYLICVPKSEIEANGYDLSLNRYKEIEREAIDHRDPKEIIAELWKLDDEITAGMKELEAML